MTAFLSFGLCTVNLYSQELIHDTRYDISTKWKQFCTKVSNILNIKKKKKNKQTDLKWQDLTPS